MDRRIGSLFGAFVGDAIAMPVHWYYDISQLRKDYGTISTYTAPKDTFKNSIMNLSNTGGGGRGSDQGDIVGSVILHGKKKYWVRGGNYHYHLGLQAGENTLEAQLARLVLKCIAEFPSKLDSEDSVASFKTYFLDKYVSFMTTPGSHNDTCEYNVPILQPKLS
jgi:ADP-ribosyl-[dinitrogen reductase] hydrolase